VCRIKKSATSRTFFIRKSVTTFCHLSFQSLKSFFNHILSSDELAANSNLNYSQNSIPDPAVEVKDKNTNDFLQLEKNGGELVNAQNSIGQQMKSMVSDMQALIKSMSDLHTRLDRIENSNKGGK
jgi:hypothetical protein